MDDEELKGLLPTQEPVEEPRAEEAAPEPVATGPERGADGKFVAKATEGAGETPALPSPTPPEPGHVPISAMLDEREKRQSLEKRLADIEAQREAERRQTAAPLEPAEQLQAALYQQNLRASRKFAEREYGKDVIAQVHDWARDKCDADPLFNQQMQASDDPYESAYQAYSREKIIAEVGPGELDAFKAWKAAQAQAQAQPVPSTASPPAPRSLVDAPGAGATGKPHVPVGEGEAFASIFKG